jgi:hypothetical protein
VLVLLTLSASAWAQTPKPAPTATTPNPTVTSTSGPMVNMWYIGGGGGLGIVENASGTGGVEVGFRVWHHLDLLLEGGYAGDLATRSQRDKAAALGATLQTSQGPAVVTSVSVPSSYVAFGARWVFESQGRYRPYVLLSAGGVAVNVKSTFVLNGADVTSTLPTFGVTLGSDLAGKYRPAAIGAGVGILRPLGPKWYVDGSIRLLNIATTDQRTNLARLTILVGRRF